MVVLLVLLAALWYFVENPASQMFGHTVTRVPLQQKIVALTFDDGPNPPYTNEIVAYLHSQHVVATFFVVGRAVEAHPNTVREEVKDGNALGNHTWDHAHLVLERSAHIALEISRPTPPSERPPGYARGYFDRHSVPATMQSLTWPDAWDTRLSCGRCRCRATGRTRHPR